MAADKNHLTLYGAGRSLAFSRGMMYPYRPQFAVFICHLGFTFYPKWKCHRAVLTNIVGSS
jgi:hypothetical protein